MLSRGGVGEGFPETWNYIYKAGTELYSFYDQTTQTSIFKDFFKSTQILYHGFLFNSYGEGQIVETLSLDSTWPT